MIFWIIVAIVIIGGFVFIKLSSTKSQIKLIFVVLLALFLFGTILVVYTNNKFELTSYGGFLDAGKVYLGWLGNGFQNLKSLTGKAIGMDWESTNGTFFNKTEIPPIKR